MSGLKHLRLPEFIFDEAPESRGNGFISAMPFAEEGRAPIETLIGTELDGRLFTDLSTLTPETPLTPAEQFFIRTRASQLINVSKPWTIQVGDVSNSIALPIEALVKESRPMGVHLMECSGNTRSARFGMLSVAAWDGVALRDVLEKSRPSQSSVRVLVSGFDRYKEESLSSEPGASWIFTPDQLFESRGFLATKMDGKPLSLDHGAPVRLVVPGWYGCVCIKWVNEIMYVPDDAPATSQMQEYAGRTMQTGVPSLAREYRPAVIEAAAMATRVEKWRIDKKVTYLVRGIEWGGPTLPPAIKIRLKPDRDFVPIANFKPGPGGVRFWTYEWTPSRTGKFTIQLRLNISDDGGTRLSSGYYDRAVEISEI